MGKKHKHEEHENHERWLVSYADFITLLFATFTALYAISTADLAKFKQFSSSMKDSFSQQGLMSGIQSILKSKPASENKVVEISSKKGEGDGVMGKYKSLVPKEGEIEGKHPAMDAKAEAARLAIRQKNQATLAQLQDIIQRLNQQVAQPKAGKMAVSKAFIDPKTGQPIKKLSRKLPTNPPDFLALPPKVKAIQLLNDKRGVRIRMDSRLLFPSGSAQLSAEAQQTLVKLADGLKPLSQTHEIQVEGHTDNQPIRTVQFPTNWQLSTARAASVVTFWIARDQMDPTHLAVMGYADSRPLADNATEAGRAQNRRIDIIVVGNDLPLPETPPDKITTDDDKADSSKGKAVPLPLHPTLATTTHLSQKPANAPHHAEEAVASRPAPQKHSPSVQHSTGLPADAFDQANTQEKPIAAADEHTAASSDYVPPKFGKIDLGMKEIAPPDKKTTH